MKKMIILSILSCSLMNAACHDCRLWIEHNKTGIIKRSIVKTYCACKRLVTWRTCCVRNCYKNNKSYRVKVVNIMKDRHCKGITPCEFCGRHHICHACGSMICGKHNICHSCQVM